MNAIPRKTPDSATDWKAKNADGKHHLKLGLEREREGADAGGGRMLSSRGFMREGDCSNGLLAPVGRMG